MSYYVLRTLSKTDKQETWKVMSRPIYNYTDAQAWKEFCEGQSKNPKHKFFIINKIYDDRI